MEPTQKDANTTRRTRVEFVSGEPVVRQASSSRMPPGEDPPTVDEPLAFRQHDEPSRHSEEVQKIQVDDEDRLAFRVGVNILTLVLIGVAAYVVWRNFFQ